MPDQSSSPTSPRSDRRPVPASPAPAAAVASVVLVDRRVPADVELRAWASTGDVTVRRFGVASGRVMIAAIPGSTGVIAAVPAAGVTTDTDAQAFWTTAPWAAPHAFTVTADGEVTFEPTVADLPASARAALGLPATALPSADRPTEDGDAAAAGIDGEDRAATEGALEAPGVVAEASGVLAPVLDLPVPPGATAVCWTFAGPSVACVPDPERRVVECYAGPGSAFVVAFVPTAESAVRDLGAWFAARPAARPTGYRVERDGELRPVPALRAALEQRVFAKLTPISATEREATDWIAVGLADAACALDAAREGAVSGLEARARLSRGELPPALVRGRDDHLVLAHLGAVAPEVASARGARMATGDAPATVLLTGPGGERHLFGEVGADYVLTSATGESVAGMHVSFSGDARSLTALERAERLTLAPELRLTETRARAPRPSSARSATPTTAPVTAPATTPTPASARRPRAVEAVAPDEHVWEVPVDEIPGGPEFDGPPPWATDAPFAHDGPGAPWHGDEAGDDRGGNAYEDAYGHDADDGNVHESSALDAHADAAPTSDLGAAARTPSVAAGHAGVADRDVARGRVARWRTPSEPGDRSGVTIQSWTTRGVHGELWIRELLVCAVDSEAELEAADVFPQVQLIGMGYSLSRHDKAAIERAVAGPLEARIAAVRIFKFPRELGEVFARLSDRGFRVIGSKARVVKDAEIRRVVAEEFGVVGAPSFVTSLWPSAAKPTSRSHAGSSRGRQPAGGPIAATITPAAPATTAPRPRTAGRSRPSA